MTPSKKKGTVKPAAAKPARAAKPPTSKTKTSRASRSPASESAGAAASAESSMPLVLVVDDYHDAREMYSEYLRFSGFRVAEATNGVEALEQAFKLLPDIILMDLSLPVLDGWEATRRLKADARTTKIPVVALTGHALPGHSEGAKEAGCDAFISKPCLPDTLVREVNKMLEGVRKGTTRTKPLRG